MTVGGADWWQYQELLEREQFEREHPVSICFKSKEREMGRYASDTGGGDFAQAPAGSHVARCIKLTDLGTQVGEYEGKANSRNQVLVTWELPNELMDDGQPFTVSKFYTNSLGDKATLRHHLVSWRGREFTPEELVRFDIQTILGAPCLISVTHTEKGKAKVDAVMRLPKGMECPSQVNPSEAFWLDEFSVEKFGKLSKGIAAIVMKSPEYQEAIGFKQKTHNPLVNGTGPAADFDDDIPF